MPVNRYVKRPETFEAIAAFEVVDAAEHAWDELPAWIREAYDAGVLDFEPGGKLKIKHPAGVLYAETDDMIINVEQAHVITRMSKADFDHLYALAPDAT